MYNEIDLELSIFGTATLGGLIKGIEEVIPQLQEKGSCDVVFDFCGALATEIHSYRGFYDHLAIGWRAQDSYLASASLLKMDHLHYALRAARGSTFTGYKGGDYKMCDETPIWVDNASDATLTAIKRLKYSPFKVIIATSNEDM